MQVPSYRCEGHPTPGESARCPICSRKAVLFKVAKQLDKEYFFGSSPAAFCGRWGYPNINVGVLSPPEQTEEAWLHDAPRYWAGHNYQIPQIVDLRSALVNSRFKANIKSPSRFLEVSQEIGMAAKPVDIEVNLYKKPTYQLSFSSFNAPMGPFGNLKKVEVTENPKIPTKIDKVVSDNDLLARDALIYLYQHEFEENKLTQLLSVGILGVKPQRKLTPTRWSITAIDDTIGKFLIEEIKKYNQTNYLAYFGGYLGNNYLILFFPDAWSYELFETYVPDKIYDSRKIKFGTDYEGYDGRKQYAFATAGGYYASRVGVLEKLNIMKKQSSVLALRFITSEYAVPLGVWVVRQSVRKCLQSKPIEFSDRNLMLDYTKKLIKKKFNYDLNFILQESILLKNIKTQTRLKRFI